MYTLESYGEIQMIQGTYFSTATNNAGSFKQKMNIIHLICFLTKVMNKKNPTKYPNSLSVLSAIFNEDLKDIKNVKKCLNINADNIRAFAYLCDDLLYGTNDEIEKPEGISNASEIKNIIIEYFTDEWIPF